MFNQENVVKILILVLIVLGFTFLISASDISQCTDSDKGRDYFIKGIVTGSESEFIDYCREDILNEFYCGDSSNERSVTREEFNCENGCFNGACREELNPQPNPQPEPEPTPEPIQQPETISEPTPEPNPSPNTYPSPIPEPLPEPNPASEPEPAPNPIPEPSEQFCIDSDDGVNPSKKGSVTTPLNTYNDYCRGEVLNEYYCADENVSNSVTRVEYECEDRCFNGICLGEISFPSPEPVPTPEPIPNPQPDPSPIPEPNPQPNPNPIPQPDPEPNPLPIPDPDPIPNPQPEPPKECKLTKAEWSRTKANGGETVTLYIDGENCNGQTINLEVYESDFGNDDLIGPSPNDAIFHYNRAVSKWKTWEHCDGNILGTCLLGNSEFYFKAYVNNENIKSNTLQVLNNNEKGEEALGEQKVALILLNYLDDEPEYSKHDYENAIFGETSGSISNFFDEVSYGKVKITGDVYDWIDADFPEATYPFAECYPSYRNLFEVADEYVNYRDYDRFVFIIRDEPKTCSFGNSGFGKREQFTPDGIVYASAARVRAYNIYNFPSLQVPGMTNSVIAHELTHSFGIHNHAAAYDCGSSVFDYDERKCNVILGGQDPFDIMAASRYWAGHPNACYKEQLEWLDDEIVEVTSSGSYIIYPYETTNERLKALKIPLSKEIPIKTFAESLHVNNYYIEYRTPLGFDSRLRGLRGGTLLAPEPIDIEGVLIHGGKFADGKCDLSVLLDMNPGTYPQNESPSKNDIIDSFLNVGDSFYDEENGIRISVVRVLGDEGIEVGIEFD